MADFLWVEKYRPKTVKDCILTDDLKKTFIEFVKKTEGVGHIRVGGTEVNQKVILLVLIRSVKCVDI